jgi:hypothetical protein
MGMWLVSNELTLARKLLSWVLSCRYMIAAETLRLSSDVHLACFLCHMMFRLDLSDASWMFRRKSTIAPP